MKKIPMLEKFAAQSLVEHDGELIFSKEKFAELVVQECAKVLTQHGAYFSGNGKPYHYAASLIEEHFGVE